MASSCVFCDIISGIESSNVRYEDENFIVFDNKLTWVPVMMLVMRKQHMDQEEYWQDHVGGREDCGRDGEEVLPGRV